MVSDFLSLYSRSFTRAIIYMLQAAEYDSVTYLKWLARVDNFNKVTYRKNLVMTRPARILLATLRIGIAAQVLTGAFLMYLAIKNKSPATVLAFTFLVSAPILWAYLIVVPLLLGRWLIVKPSNWLKIRSSKKIFAAHPGVKIAITGSYGKTSMKEILQTVLSEGKKVAATPGNKNVAISHALFAGRLKGDEEVLIIEYGEGGPGDVARFAKITHPGIAIITGLAPAHLDKYKTLKRAGNDIFSVVGYVGEKNTYVNGDSPEIRNFSKNLDNIYSSAGLEDWEVKNLKISIKGLSFDLTHTKQTIKVRSRLLGSHQAGPLVLAVVLASKLGLNSHQIEKGIAKIEPFEHRMKPYQLSGAWIVDDTYNGNAEGMRAGLALLAELPAKRKIYITPGLVDQGSDEADIHRRLGQDITHANPDQVVLMKHSVTDYILAGMKDYKGQVVIEDDPLEFYTNLDKFVAAGDLVLMQNDWPDNYN